MFIGALVSEVKTLGHKRRAADVELLCRTSRVPESDACVSRDTMARGVDVETEIRTALTALADSARRQRIELQMAAEPMLTALAGLADCQACLRDLIAAALYRAESGVLVTALRQGSQVDIEILDDCPSPPFDGAPLAQPSVVPEGATVSASHEAGYGNRVVLRLPGVLE